MRLEGRCGSRLIVGVFSLAIVASAFLLFLMEPLFGRLMMPVLGGSAAVWTTAMLFYQVALLAGYAYAHLTGLVLSPGRQSLVHLAMVGGAALSLPLALPAGWTPPLVGNPAPAVLGMMAVAIGLPFAVLSATTPMLQRWLAATDHPAAANPYVLYAASNLGSFAALLAYPALIEPTLGLKAQAGWWSIAWAGFAALVAAAAILRAIHPAPPPPTRTAAGPEARGTTVSWATIGRWLVLALVPSSLLLSTTTYISTDLASIPLLWILPLALYLLAFVVVFAERPILSAATVAWVFPFLLIPLIITLVPTLARSGVTDITGIPLHLACFFVAALICGFELVRIKPAPRHLTLFYLVVAAGGALGGVFNGLIAPSLFNGVYEYPLGLILVCLLRPSSARLPVGAAVALASLAGLFAAAPYLMTGDADPVATTPLRLGLAAGALCIFASRHDRLCFAAAVSAFLGAAILAQSGSGLVYAERNFYGVNRVRDIGPVRYLEHGSTVHGAEALDAASRTVPLSYYSADGGLGRSVLGIVKTRAAAHIAIIGLGTGGLVCHGTAGTSFDLYEIDPAVVAIASDPALFRYLSDCPSRHRIVLGDGRLTIARSAGSYDQIVIDAFSGDSVPTHLLTTEAIQVYLDRLAPGGRIVFHLSNRYLNLAPPVIAAARALGLTGVVGLFTPAAITASDGTRLPTLESLVAAFARTPRDLGDLARADGWEEMPASRPGAAWTDDRSNLLGALLKPW